MSDVPFNIIANIPQGIAIRIVFRITCQGEFFCYIAYNIKILKTCSPEIVNDIRAAVNRKFMTDNVGQTLLRLGRISTEYYRPERDVTSPRFTTRPRILYDHVDYDAVMAASKHR